MYELENKKLTLYFSPEYSPELLKNDKRFHLAWILTNPNVLKMFKQLGENMLLKRQVLFGFGFETFNFKARISRKGNRVRVLEILGFKNKRIFADEIEIYHAGMKMAETSQEPKKRKYINLSNDEDENKELLSDVDGSIDNSELIETNKIIHEYENFPIIKRIKKNIEKKRTQENDQTKVLYIQGNHLRTTADSGGMETLKGLEFDSLENATMKGELQEFIELLKLLEKRSGVIRVTIIKGVLSEGLKERKYSKLSDGITQRKYIIGKLLLNDEREFSLIEIEREDKSLSMLLLQSYGNINWMKIYSSLLLGLVNESGKWSNKVLNEIENRGIIITRVRHLNKNIYEKEKYIYEKIDAISE